MKESIPIADYIQSLVPYVPGKPIEETKRELGLRKVVKLASNENPLGPSPKAIRVIQKESKELHRYPDSSGFHLKRALAKKLKVLDEQIILGNGSNEVIDLLIRTYCVPGDAIATSKAAFIAYRIGAQSHGVRVYESELTQDLRFDLEKIFEAVEKDSRVRMVFIANPNNPTGTYVRTDELERFLLRISELKDRTVLVVLDYAYWEYVTAPNLPDPYLFMRRFENVVVLQTFSKVYGLAGLRVGFGVGDTKLISMTQRIREPFNVNSIALKCAEVALTDQAFVKRSRQSNIRGMKLWKTELEKMNIPFWESQGNFLLVDVQKGLGRSGTEAFQSLLRKGIIFRPVHNYGLGDALRITIGTEEENKTAVRVLWREVKDGWSRN